MGSKESRQAPENLRRLHSITPAGLKKPREAQDVTPQQLVRVAKE